MGLFSRIFRRAPARTRAGHALPCDAPRGDAARSGEDSTRIDREHFLLYAPYEWTEVPSEQPLEFDFRNQSLPEQLIVTVLLARQRFGPAQLSEVAEQLTSTRLKVVSQLSQGRAITSPVDYRSGSGQVEARSAARVDAENVRQAWVVRVAPMKVVTVALTRYTTQEIGMPFDMYASAIFDFLQVKDPC